MGGLIANKLNIGNIRPYIPRNLSFDQGGIVGSTSGSTKGTLVRSLIGDDEIKRFVNTPAFFSSFQKLYQEKGRELTGR